jgi:hypothetical protein
MQNSATTMDILGKLFGTPARVKLMRLFLFNTDTVYDVKTACYKTRVQKASGKKELNALTTIGFIKKKIAKGKTLGYSLNPDFRFLGPIKSLLIDPEFLSKEELVGRLKGAGKLKMLVASGVFLQNPDSRLDLLIVSDKLKRPVLDEAVRKLESEIGKELAYAVFDTEEFKYRLEMYDKLVSDVFDFEHEKLITAPEFSTLIIKKKA